MLVRPQLKILILILFFIFLIFAIFLPSFLFICVHTIFFLFWRILPLLSLCLPSSLKSVMLSIAEVECIGGIVELIPEGFHSRVILSQLIAKSSSDLDFWTWVFHRFQTEGVNCFDLRTCVMFLSRFWHLSWVFDRQVYGPQFGDWLNETELVRKGCLEGLVFIWLESFLVEFNFF